MPGIARATQDTAGGLITGILAPTVFVNGKPVACLGATVAGHGTGAHANPTMVEASSKVYANGIGVCRAGDKASCGDAATGSSNVNAS
jgi:uncharacterized Zn-binding protein involved in type VI secretion